MRYELFDAALRAAGIHQCDHDEFIDHGDDLRALIHPAVKALLLNRVVPDLSRFLIDYNASLTRAPARSGVTPFWVTCD